MKTPREMRADLLDFIKKDLIGPAHGDLETLEDSPKIRYTAGVLFPQESRRNESAAAAGVEADPAEGPVNDVDPVDLEGTEFTSESGPGASDTGDDSEHDEIVVLANSYKPSAVGLSCLVEGPEPALVVRIHAAIYDSHTEAVEGGAYKRTYWTRKPLKIAPLTLDLNELDREVIEGIKLRCVARPRLGNRILLTLSLYNTTAEASKSAKTFFQVGFEVVASDGSPVFVEYRSLQDLPSDEDETALSMLYRKRRVFAVGHGCAADWMTAGGDKAALIRTEALPSVTVPPIVPLELNESYLSMEFLAAGTTQARDQIPDALHAFCRRYEAWIQARREELPAMPKGYGQTAKRHIHLCEVALQRMRDGIILLKSNDVAFEGFQLANRVMLMQQQHSRLRRGLRDPWKRLPSATEYTSDWDGRRGYWRAFQLAFILMAINGIANADSEHIEIDGKRVAPIDVVDLIWFPTGGGKTEAYLGVAAYAIFTSRICDPGRDGTRVIMRYTLRLLTTQQFQRAASMICACELIRRTEPERFGEIPISLGLWVGKSLTPNDEKDALKKMDTLAKKGDEAKNPFQLLSCPWCGTELNNPDNLGYVEYKNRQIFLCPSEEDSGDCCPFTRHDSPLPVCVVDESVYKRPPTIIIGTVDKFAMLAWRDQAGRIFDVGNGPDLIIQDELHLISGPLGSLVGLYEGVIDYLSSRAGKKPKIIASTATIRRAEVQCRALYDREMFQFPPPGLDASDSFFAHEDPNATGRIYAGLLPTAASSSLTAQIRGVVALQQGVLIACGKDARDEVIDPYWTLVQYFSSLKELGRAATFITGDIPEFLPTMHRRYALEAETKRYMRTSEELTGRKDEDEIPRILKRLEQHYRRAAAPRDQALDTVLATNMISVGVDVDRLGLIMIVTQPKGTSEYIQASSRIGRSASSPGLVLTLYNAGRSRDRSHYEQFRNYHEAFYRTVEPTSVTPFSPPAMERALHAVLVIAGRHIAGWRKPDQIDLEEPRFGEFLQFLRNRVRSVDATHLSDFEELLSRRLEEWAVWRPERWGVVAGACDDTVLMRVAGTAKKEDAGESWETPTSMRNVDTECSATVVPRYNPAGGRV